MDLSPQMKSMVPMPKPDREPVSAEIRVFT